VNLQARKADQECAVMVDLKRVRIPVLKPLKVLNLPNTTKAVCLLTDPRYCSKQKPICLTLLSWQEIWIFLSAISCPQSDMAGALNICEWERKRGGKEKEKEKEKE
jgi:hypothetical protein